MEIQERKYEMQRRVKEYWGRGCIGNMEEDVRRGIGNSVG